jgi:toxin ParE1/3/4
LTHGKKQRPKAVVELTHQALMDLREIERYSVKRWGRKSADKYLDDIAAALDRLADNPDVLRLEPNFAPGLFFYRVHKHVLVCDDQGSTVIVLTVIHTRMDLPARLVELEPRLIAESQILRSKRRQKPGKS